jgi:hypothetical protein
VSTYAFDAKSAFADHILDSFVYAASQLTVISHEVLAIGAIVVSFVFD